MKPAVLTIKSTDTTFMLKLIDWLNKQTVKPDSTILIHSNDDPHEELEMRKAQIDGMAIRIHDLERERS